MIDVVARVEVVEVANLWTAAKEQMRYLLYGSGSNTPSRSLVPVPQPAPALRSVIFESHLQEMASGRNNKLPQTISSAWDEREAWGLDTVSRSWQGLTPQERKLIMLDIYLNNPNVSACVDVIAKRIFSGGYVVEKVDEEGPDNLEHEEQLHEFALRINPDWDFNQLGRALITDELIYGECYSEILWQDGMPWQLIKVDCPTMFYKANKWGQIESFYQQMETTLERNAVDPQNIIRWWFPHPRASIDPFAPAEKVSDAVLIDKKMMNWMTTFFQKGAKFPYYIKGVAGEDEADRFKTWFLNNVAGEKNAHMIPITWGTAEFAPLGNVGGLDMDFGNGLDRMRTLVFAAFGVPPAAVSIIESGNIGGGTGEDQDKSLIFNACDPIKSAFFEKLNYRIVQKGMGITDYRYSARYAEYRSDQAIAQTEDLRLKNGSRTINEIRAESGKRPYQGNQGGDVPFIWSSKEITPVPRLGDLEIEQRETAAAALQAAQAQADLAQTKAKQAKEPQPTPPALLNAPGQQNQQNQNGQQPQQNNAQQPGKPVQKNGKKPVIKQPQKSQKQQEAIQLSLLDQEDNSQQNTGAMVALMIPPEIGQQIAIAEGEPVEDLHITLAYLGEMADLDAERLDHLKSALKFFASSRQPLYGRIAGAGCFDAPEGQPCPIIALPDIPGLPAFRQQLIDLLAACETPAQQNHGYTPHITLQYIDAGQPTGTRMLDFKIKGLNLSFDAICLVVGDERTYFPLLGQKLESQESTSPVPDNLWVRPDIDFVVQQLAAQGVIEVTWGNHPGSCDMCHGNAGVTVKLGQPFPSGHVLPPGHPNCVCPVEYAFADGHKEIEKSIYDPNATTSVNDPDDTQEMPALKNIKRNVRVD